jgi:hypothetical protein
MPNNGKAAEPRIRKEFNESPSQVISGFAKMKVSKRLAAGAMGITTQTLLRLCKRYSIEFVPQSDMVEQCKAKGKGWIKGRSRKEYYASKSQRSR